MKRFFLFALLVAGRLFSQEEDTTYKGLRFAQLELSALTTDLNRTMIRVGPEAKFDFTYEHKFNFWMHFRNAAWYDHAFAEYSNKQAIFNLAYSSDQKKYLNLETGLAWNISVSEAYHGVRAGVMSSTFLLPLYYDGTGKNYCAPYSIKQEVNNALPDTLWTWQMNNYPGFDDSASVYGVSTSVRSADVFLGYQLRTGYDPHDKWFNEGSHPEFSEYYFDMIYNLYTKAERLQFGNTEFAPQMVKLNKFGFRVGWKRQTNLLFGLYYGVEFGIRPGYNFYNAEKIAAGEKASARNTIALAIKLGFKISAPTKLVKKYI